MDFSNDGFKLKLQIQSSVTKIFEIEEVNFSDKNDDTLVCQINFYVAEAGSEYAPKTS